MYKPHPDRCWRLALPCRPQAYTHPGYDHRGARAQQGRSEQEEKGDEKQQGEAQEEERPQPERRSKRRRAVLQRQEREAAAAETASPSPRLLEMAFTRASPRVHAELASQEFMALHAQGQVAPEKALFIMYVLGLYRVVCVGDAAGRLGRLLPV